MAIRIRVVDGIMVALCAARSIPKEGDIYLHDGIHHALSTKFALDFNSEGWGNADIPYDDIHVPLIDREESNNANRDDWDRTFGQE